MAERRDAEVRAKVARAWAQAVGPEVFTDLTWEQIAELHQNITETLDYEPPEKVVAAVEETSPKLAAELQKRGRREIKLGAAEWLAIFQILLQIHGIGGDALSPLQSWHIFNLFNVNIHIEETTVINPPPINPPPSPAGGAGGQRGQGGGGQGGSSTPPP